MNVYRIGKERYIKDLSGEGARLYGGRWNRKGTAVLYTAENRSLATVEYLVHLPIALIPEDVFIAEIFIPDGIRKEQVKIKDLPKKWSQYPAPMGLSEIGEKWIKKNKSLILKVPSSVVKGEWNVLVNTKHELFGKIRISKIEPYNFDKRLLREN